MDALQQDDLWITWSAYEKAIEDLALLVDSSGWSFDQILCLARGGLMPGDIFSRIFQVPLAILSTSSYRDKEGTLRGRLDIANHVTTPAGTLSGRILLLDDLVDSGTTLSAVQTHLRNDFPEVTEVRSAVIWCKESSAMRPDFCLEYLHGNPWIHQPFEKYDRLRLEGLRNRK